MKTSFYYFILTGFILLSSCTFFSGGNKSACDNRNVIFNTGYDRINSTAFQPTFLSQAQKDIKWQVTSDLTGSQNDPVDFGIVENQGIQGMSALPNSKWLISPFEYRSFHQYIFAFCLSKDELSSSPDIIHFDLIGIVYDINSTSGVWENYKSGGLFKIEFNNNIIHQAGVQPQNSLSFDIQKSQLKQGINELRIDIGTINRVVLSGTMMSMSADFKTTECCSN